MADTPPIPPPKPGSHETSGLQTPSPVPPVPPPHPASGLEVYHPSSEHDVSPPDSELPAAQSIPDPGDNWLPEYLADKSCVSPPPRAFFAANPPSIGYKT